MHRTVIMAAAMAVLANVVHAGEIDPALTPILDAAPPGEVVSTIVYLADQVDAPALSAQLAAAHARRGERHETVVRELRAVADFTQAGFLAACRALPNADEIARIEPFWVANCVRIDASPAVIRAIADRPEVERVYFNLAIESVAPVGPAVADDGAADGAALGGPEPGLVAIRAPEAWAIGYTGAGVVVASLDTGVDGGHPALADRWRGVSDARYAGHPEWAFFDPVTGWTTPQDSGSHGTHTMGTICGGVPGDPVGVAPEAEWIHAAVIDRVSVEQTVADAISAFQWMVDPDGDPGTSWDVPVVCSNSWGVASFHGYPECDELFWSFIDACETAGIVVVFAAGNEGPDPMTLRRPADRATDDYRTLAVAAVDANTTGWPVASFSSRGPSFCTPSGEAAIKPDIAAPGVNVRSSVPGGGYSSYNGTSMATPHIAGVVALVRQANPDLAVEQVKQIIFDTASDLGDAGEDNLYGWGMADAFAAVQMAESTVAVTFAYPEGRPEFIDPVGGTTVRVEVSAQQSTPVPASGVLYVTTSGIWVPYAMTEVEPDVYDAVFPAVPCGATVSYYFSVELEGGGLVTSPFTAPDTTYSGLAYTGTVVALEDNFETDLGWTVENDPSLTDGAWERGVPAGAGDRGDPLVDGDGSGQCYLTHNAPGNTDVDGGPTQLISPLLDATGLPDAMISYDRWFTNDDNDADSLLVEISADGGDNWTVVENVTGGGGGWITVDVRIADYTDPPTSSMRLRFSATDNPNDSVTEAGVDGVRLWSFTCGGGGIPGDVDGDGDVDFTDLLSVLGAWGPCPGCPQDLDGDGFVTFADVLVLLGNWS